MRHMFELLSVNNNRISAIGASSQLPLHTVVDRDDKCNNAEVARLLSHLKAIDTAAASDGSLFLLAEDNLSLKFLPFLRKADNVSEIVARAPADWDVILLSWVHKDRMVREFTDWNRLFGDGNHVLGGFAYLLRRSGIEKISKYFEFKDGVFRVNNRWVKPIYAPAQLSMAADVFIFSRLTTYIYHRRVFAVQDLSSVPRADRVDPNRFSQSVIFDFVDTSVLEAESDVDDRRAYGD